MMLSDICWKGVANDIMPENGRSISKSFNVKQKCMKQKRCAHLTQKLVFIFVVMATLYAIRTRAESDGRISNRYASLRSRRLLQVASNNDTVEVDDEKNCTEPSIHEFPDDFFTEEQRSQGAIIIHFLVSIYMFIALAIICDDYFVPSLEQISEKLHFTEDVAGATFMAAGSSAPELFTSIIGVFVAKGDVGVGTIVGSAVFNILVIIGLCSICCATPVSLHWWPLMRDSSYYGIAIAVLIGVIYDGEVTWAESLIMLLLYCGYIVIMKFNNQIENFVTLTRQKTVKKLNKHRGKSDCYNPESGQKNNQSDMMSYNNEKKVVLTSMNGSRIMDQSSDDTLLPQANGSGSPTKHHQNSPLMLSVDEVIFARSRPIGFEEAGLRVMMSSTFAPKTRLRMACKVLIHERQNLLLKNADVGSTSERFLVCRKGDDSITFGSSALSETSPMNEQPEVEIADDDDTSFTHPLRPPRDHWWTFCKWILCWPISFLLFFTIPNCGKKRWERWFLVSFVLSTLWIAGCSYIMVWMVVICGYTLNIPDTIMGITFLAAGTSVPDTIASVIVARQGLGDMAVSNSLGSNVFDILLGLALPWFIKTAIMKNDSVIINSRGLLWSVLLLMTSLLFVISAIHYSGWRLTKKLGVVVLIAYLFFLTFSVLIEFNVFFPVNLPMCR